MRVFIKKNERVLKAILIVIFYSLLPMVGLIFYMSLGQKEIALQMARITASNRIKEIVLIERELMSKTETFLLALSKIDEINNRNPEKCNKLLGVLLEKSNFFRNIFVSDLQGNVYCSAVPLSGKVNITDRKYFINVVSNRRFSLGDYQIGRVTNRPVWVAAYPIINDDDVLTGMVGASVDLEWLTNLLAKQQLPSGSTLKVFDDKGVVLTSYPDSSEIGKTKAKDKEISYVLSGKESPVELKSSDNVDRLYVFSPLKPSANNEQKYVLLGINKSFMDKPIDEVFKRNLILVAIITVVVFIVVLITWRLFIYQEFKS